MMPMIVVTGCNGFIGNNIVDAILKLDPQSLGCPIDSEALVTSGGRAGMCYFEVLGADLAQTAGSSNASRYMRSRRFTFVAHDQLAASIRALPRKPVAIVHNGACSSTVETNAAVFKALNLEYSQSLWNLCAELEIPFIYASSAAVYGDGALGFSDSPEDNDKYEPLNLYGRSKHDFDRWVLTQAKAPPSWFGLRYFNVYGPFEAQKAAQASMVYHGYMQATRTGKIKLFESNTPSYSHGNQLRDFVYVKDVVDLTIKLLQRCFIQMAGGSAAHSCFINIGVGKARSWNDLATAVFASLEMPVQIEYIPLPASLTKQYQNFTCASLGGLTKIDLQHTFIDLEEGVKAYVLRYLLRGL